MEQKFIPNQTVCLKQSADYVCGNQQTLLFAYHGKSWFVDNITGKKSRVSTEEARQFAIEHDAVSDYEYSIKRK